MRDPRPEYMLAAIQQAKIALDAGNIPIGAIIVHEDQIIARGLNAIDFPADDTHHAELSAIQSVAAFLAEHKRECTIYTTLEPCMMCLGAIINVGIDSLVIGAPDSLVGGLKLLSQAEYYQRKLRSLKLTVGYMNSDCQALLDEYVRRSGMRQHLSQDAA